MPRDRLQSLIHLEPRYWFNPEVRSQNFLIPGSVAIIMTLIGTLLTALVVAREWERGTMEALMATPIGVSEFLLGKLIPYFLLGMAAMCLADHGRRVGLRRPLSRLDSDAAGGDGSLFAQPCCRWDF